MSLNILKELNLPTEALELYAKQQLIRVYSLPENPIRVTDGVVHWYITKLYFVHKDEQSYDVFLKADPDFVHANTLIAGISLGAVGVINILSNMLINDGGVNIIGPLGFFRVCDDLSNFLWGYEGGFEPVVIDPIEIEEGYLK